MQEIQVTASDPSDQYARKWMMWRDSVPPQNWFEQSYETQLDDANLLLQVGNVTSGDTLVGNDSANFETIPDGDHTIYIGISQDGGAQYGTYSGSVTFGQGPLQQNPQSFNGFDASHIGAWKVSVVNGIIVSASDIRQNSSGSKMGIGSMFTAILDKVTSEVDKVAKIPFVDENLPTIKVVAVAVPLASGFAAWWLSRGKRVRRGIVA